MTGDQERIRTPSSFAWKLGEFSGKNCRKCQAASNEEDQEEEDVHVCC